MPEGSRFKGYATYSVQELSLTPKDVMYKLEVWQTPDGSVIRAMVPAEVEGSHFGAELRALIHGLYASGMTQPAIFQFISNVGIEISEGQIHNILMGEAESYEKQSEAILSAGLQEAPYIRVDDTGAKHCHQNGYCTHIGGQYFAYYKSTDSKSRLNFLRLLAQGKEGFIQETLKAGQVLISDRAGQFAILNHADCWVHMERPLRKLIASTPKIEQEIRQVREAIWILYEQVKEASLSQQGKAEVHAAYDALLEKEVVSPGARRFQRSPRRVTQIFRPPRATST